MSPVFLKAPYQLTNVGTMEEGKKGGKNLYKIYKKRDWVRYAKKRTFRDAEGI